MCFLALMLLRTLASDPALPDKPNQSCLGVGCFSCLNREYCPETLFCGASSLQCAECPLHNPYYPPSSTNPIYLKFDGVCVNTYNPSRSYASWELFDVVTLSPSHLTHTVSFSLTTPTYRGLCLDDHDYRNPFRFGHWFRVRPLSYYDDENATSQDLPPVPPPTPSAHDPETPNIPFPGIPFTDKDNECFNDPVNAHYLVFAIQTNNCPSQVTVELTQSLDHWGQPTEPVCFAQTTINPHTTEFSSLSTRVCHPDRDYYLLVSMHDGAVCDVTITLAKDTSPLAVVAERTVDLAVLEHQPSVTILLDFLRFSWYDFPNSILPQRTKALHFRIVGDVPPKKVLRIAPLSGHVRMVVQMHCKSSDLRQCEPGFIWTSKENAGKNAHANKLVVGLRTNPEYFRLFSLNERQNVVLEVKYICEDDCGGQTHGMCSYQEGRCVCYDGYYGDRCDPICFYQGEWRVNETAGLCRYGVPFCRENCTCADGYVEQNHACIAYECTVDTPTETMCLRGTSQCRDDCSCAQGYHAVMHRCVSDLCGNGILDPGEECDRNGGYCLPTCRCPRGMVANTRENRCVSPSLSWEAYLGISLGFAVVLVVFVVILVFVVKTTHAIYRRYTHFLETQPAFPLNPSDFPEIDACNNTVVSFSPATLTFGLETKLIKRDETRFQQVVVKNLSRSHPLLVIFHPPCSTKYTLHINPLTATIAPRRSTTVTAYLTVFCTTELAVKIPVTAHVADKHTLAEFEKRLSSALPIPQGAQACPTPSYSSALVLSVKSENSLLVDADSILCNPTPIGQGRHGIVYLANWYDRPFAAQRLRTDDFTDEEKAELFTTLLTIANKPNCLRTPFVVPCSGFVLHTPIPCILTPYFPLGSLAHYLHPDRPTVLSLALRLQILKDVARGLHFLHDLNRPHLHVKPSNIMLHSLSTQNACVAKLCDTPLNDLWRRHTLHAGGAFGNPRYTAPEIYNDQWTAAADVYSLAVVAWETHYDTPPFRDARTVFEIRNAVVKGVRPGFDGPISSELRSLIESAWEQDPKKRTTAMQFQRTLEGMIAAENRGASAGKGETKQRRADTTIAETNLVEACTVVLSEILSSTQDNAPGPMTECT